MQAFKIKRVAPQGCESLCHTCTWAHMQKGFRESEESIFCGYSYPMRAVRFAVRECTDYSNRTLMDWSEMKDIALIIESKPTSKQAGFRREVTDEGEEDESEKPVTIGE